jgi:ureidoacrylate peracid hydrolase
MMSEAIAELQALTEPQRTAVVMIDVQKAFTDESRVQKYPPLAEVLDRSRSFVGEARRAGVRVIWVQVTHPAETNSAVWLRQHANRPATYLEPGSEEAQFHPGFGPEQGELLVTKHRYSAFAGTPLELILRSLGVETLIVAGLTTDVCVSSTVRDAFQRDFNVITLRDCTAEVSRARYEAAIEAMGSTFGRVQTSEEVLAAWRPRLAAAPATH